MLKDRYLRLSEVVKFSGLSKNTVLRRTEDGTFPPKHDLGGRSVGWRESELNNWFEAPANYRQSNAQQGECATI